MIDAESGLVQEFATQLGFLMQIGAFVYHGCSIFQMFKVPRALGSSDWYQQAILTKVGT